MKLSKLKNRKAISPVIATVILVAVAITIAVAVSYWMSGIAGQYTKFEKVEIQAASCEKLTDANGPSLWRITLTLKNSGSATSTLNGVYVDDIVAVYFKQEYLGGLPIPPLADTTVPPSLTPNKYTKIYADVGLGATETVSIPSGQTKTVFVYVGTSWPSVAAPITSGTTIDVKLHSANGMDYIKLLGLV